MLHIYLFIFVPRTNIFPCQLHVSIIQYNVWQFVFGYKYWYFVISTEYTYNYLYNTHFMISSYIYMGTCILYQQRILLHPPTRETIRVGLLSLSHILNNSFCCILGNLRDWSHITENNNESYWSILNIIISYKVILPGAAWLLHVYWSAPHRWITCNMSRLRWSDVRGTNTINLISYTCNTCDTISAFRAHF